jgi:hypothetical protein
MLKRSSLLLFAMAILQSASLLVSSPVFATNIPGTSIPTTVTRVMISNSTSAPVTIGVTVQVPGAGTQDGCAATIGNLFLIDSGGNLNALTVNPGNGNQGTFAIAGGSVYELVSTLTNPNPVGGAPASQNCLQGLTVTFAAYQQCPNGGAPFPVPSSVPNGVNQYEPTLNLPGTIGGNHVGGNETMDITCVNGANSILQVTINSPSATNLWTYDQSKTVPSGGSITSQNSWVNVAQKCDDNCSITVGGVTTDRPFVYPFGCTQCNRLPDPAPPCGQFCAAQNGLPPNTGCTIDRSPGSGIETTQFGGTVLVSYLGPAIPPATCPGSNPTHNHKTFGKLPPEVPYKLAPKPTAKQLREFYAFKELLLLEFLEHGIRHKPGDI